MQVALDADPGEGKVRRRGADEAAARSQHSCNKAARSEPQPSPPAMMPG